MAHQREPVGFAFVSNQIQPQRSHLAGNCNHPKTNRRSYHHVGLH